MVSRNRLLLQLLLRHHRLFLLLPLLLSPLLLLLYPLLLVLLLTPWALHLLAWLLPLPAVCRMSWDLFLFSNYRQSWCSSYCLQHSSTRKHRHSIFNNSSRHRGAGHTLTRTLTNMRMHPGVLEL